MSIIKELELLRSELSDAETAKSRAEGQKKALMDRLKDEFDVDTVKAARKKLDKMHKECDELEETLEKEVKRIKKAFYHD